jgi:hypothetical protein
MIVDKLCWVRVGPAQVAERLSNKTYSTHQAVDCAVDGVHSQVAIQSHVVKLRLCEYEKTQDVEDKSSEIYTCV